MIVVQDLTKIYKQQTTSLKALDNVSLTINAHEIFGVIGKSGSGKSTLLRCMNRLETPSLGQIFFDSTQITALPMAKLRQQRKQIGMIFQSFNLLRFRTVYENVALPLELLKTPKATIRNKVFELLELVNLIKHQYHTPEQLSGGQKQRVAIARALITQPKWLLCDEPTSALDPKSTLQVLDLLKDIQKKLQITIVLITHEMNVIKNVCDRVAVLDQGHLIETGRVIDLFIRPQTKIAKAFIQDTLHLELPAYLRDSLKPAPADQLNPVVQLGFLGSAATEPIIANVLKKFDVTVNILQADLESIQGAAMGFLVCKLEGKHENILRATQYLNTLKINVETIGYV